MQTLDPEGDVDRRTISDFGDQWTRFTDNPGYYGSVDLLADIAGPLLRVDELKGVRAAEIGSGTGRIVDMLLRAGAATVLAIEPSRAIEVLKRNLAHYGDRVIPIHATGEAIGDARDLDLVVSIGVLHHVVAPEPIVRAAYRALRPGGRMLIWLYGREGNQAYLAIVGPIRAVTTRLPHAVLVGLSTGLCLVADAYALACRVLPLPLAGYMRSHFSRLDLAQRRLTVYDQLNPAYARYYRQSEAGELLADSGFVNVGLYHRHKYSWTVIGRKPEASASP